MREPREPDASPVPKFPNWLIQGFLRYARSFMRKRFHTLSVDASQLQQHPIPADAPLIVYGNHPGWWDPIVAAILRSAFFPERSMYAPIDAQALEKYRILKKLGFYGLELDQRRGAEAFLKVSRAILQAEKTSIWMTPEGRFCDPRDRSATLMPGLSHLASRVEGIYVVPLAIEYVFWEEQRPEALCVFGQPITSPREMPWDKGEWSQHLTDGLRRTQDSLAEASIHRDAHRFSVILHSGKKSNSWYDFFRRWSGWVRGGSSDLAHGNKFRDRGDLR